MYASKSSAPENYYDAPPQPLPQLGGQAAATGIPVNTTGQYYHGNTQSTHLNRAPGPWSSGLFDCFSDCSNCCITFWCPCITFGQIAEITDQGSTSCVTSGALYAIIAFVTGCGCLYSCFYRSKIRQQYVLGESPCGDCCVHFCCEACALCQEYRQLKSQGFDMSIGWQGNVAQRTRGVEMAATAPVVQGGMNR